MNEEMKEAMKDIVLFYWATEQKHWEELHCPDKHIFVKLDFIKHQLIGR